MKVFFEETNGNNLVIITDGATAKIYDCAPSGIFEGIDLYTETTAEEPQEAFLRSWQEPENWQILKICTATMN